MLWNSRWSEGCYLCHKRKVGKCQRGVKNRVLSSPGCLKSKRTKKQLIFTLGVINVMYVSSLYLKSPQRGSHTLGNTDHSVHWWVIQQIGSSESKKYPKGTSAESAGMSLRSIQMLLQSIWNLLTLGNDDSVIDWVGFAVENLDFASTQPHDWGSRCIPQGCSLMPECWLYTTMKKLPVSQDRCERGYLWFGWQAYSSGCAALVAATHFSVSPPIL